MLNSNLKVLGADSFKKQELVVGERFVFIIFINTFCFFCEKVQIPNFIILVGFLLNLAPVSCRCNEIEYPRGF